MVRPLELYNHAVAPNPRRVRIFAAEKGIELALEDVDVLTGQTRTPEFLAKNSSKLRDTPHTWAEWSCSQLLQNTPLHPLAEWGRVRFGSADASPEQRLMDLEGSLAQVKLDPAENAELLAPLLDIPLPPERVLSVAPEELRHRQLAALTNWAIASAKVQPLVLSVEDLH